MGNRKFKILHTLMKTFVALVALLVIFQQANAISCAATQYCMGCSSTNVCSSCFNWGSGTVGARSLASSTCTASLTRTASNSKYYSGTHTNSSNWAVGSAVCTGGKHFTVNSTGATPYTATCASAVPTGVTAVANCEYPQVSTTSSGSTAYCALCKKGKGGNSTSTSCAGTAITNCDYAYGTSCGACKSKYAVASTGLTCTAFTTDSNCRQLASDGTCGSCWHAYYFNATVCKLFAKIAVAGFAMAISAFLF